MKLACVWVLGLGLVGTAFGSAVGGWRKDVPEKDRVRVNPVAADAGAAAAGGEIFRERCASCHGGDANGRGARPSLRTERVRGATDGELQWLLRNGSLRKGMPSWSGLPEVQRWELVRYLRELPEER